MNHPAYDHAPDTAPSPGDVEGEFVIHSEMTTCLHKLIAVNEAEALGQWLGSQNVRSELICGRLLAEPFRHLEAKVADAGTEQAIHVARERTLTSHASRWF